MLYVIRFVFSFVMRHSWNVYLRVSHTNIHLFVSRIFLNCKCWKIFNVGVTIMFLDNLTVRNFSWIAVHNNLVLGSLKTRNMQNDNNCRMCGRKKKTFVFALPICFASVVWFGSSLSINNDYNMAIRTSYYLRRDYLDT